MKAGLLVQVMEGGVLEQVLVRLRDKRPSVCREAAAGLLSLFKYVSHCTRCETSSTPSCRSRVVNQSPAKLTRQGITAESWCRAVDALIEGQTRLLNQPLHAGHAVHAWQTHHTTS